MGRKQRQLAGGRTASTHWCVTQQHKERTVTAKEQRGHSELAHSMHPARFYSWIFRKRQNHRDRNRTKVARSWGLVGAGVGFEGRGPASRLLVGVQWQSPRTPQREFHKTFKLKICKKISLLENSPKNNSGAQSLR